MGYAISMSTQSETHTEFVIRRLREAMPKAWPDIAAHSGVPITTINKVAYRDTKDPRSSTIDKLYAYFESVDAQPDAPVNPGRRKEDRVPEQR